MMIVSWQRIAQGRRIIAAPAGSAHQVVAAAAHHVIAAAALLCPLPVIARQVIDIPGRMLLMDGMCKRVGLMLMKLIAGETLQKPDIQNKRLFNFDCEKDFIAFYRRETAAGAARFSALLSRAYALLPQIPKERQLFFQSNLILQIETMLGLYQWVYHLCAAKENGSEFAREIREAAQALERIAQARTLSTGQHWKNWWAGDTLMDIKGLIRSTGSLLRPENNEAILKAGF